MVHYLQQANYVPALQLNQTLKMNLAVCLKSYYSLIIIGLFKILRGNIKIFVYFDSD